MYVRASTGEEHDEGMDREAAASRVPAAPLGGLRARPGGVLLGGGAQRAGGPARRRPQHRARGGRPARRRRARTASRAALAGTRGEVHDFTYANCARLTNRFANVLAGLGVGAGERVFVLAGRIPELYIAVLGSLKHGGVVLPAVLRVRPGADRHPHDHRRRRACWSPRELCTAEGRADPRPPAVAASTCCWCATSRRADCRPGTHDLRALLAKPRPTSSTSRRPIPRTWRCCTSPAAPPASRRARCTCTRRSSPTTSPASYALDLHPDDVFWCTADPGWVTGTSYGIIAPLTNGVTMIVDEAEFDAERWYAHPAGPAGQRLVHGARPRSAC